MTDGERNDVAGEQNNGLNLHLASAEGYEYDVGVEEVDKEIEKEVEDDRGVVSTVQGDYSPAALPGIRQQHLAGAARFQKPPLGFPKLLFLSWSSAFHCAGKYRLGEDFSHSRGLVAPPICRSRDIGFLASRRSAGSASSDGVGGGAFLQLSETLKSQTGYQSTRGLGSEF